MLYLKKLLPKQKRSGSSLYLEILKKIMPKHKDSNSPLYLANNLLKIPKSKRSQSHVEMILSFILFIGFIIFIFIFINPLAKVDNKAFVDRDIASIISYITKDVGKVSLFVRDGLPSDEWKNCINLNRDIEQHGLDYFVQKHALTSPVRYTIYYQDFTLSKGDAIDCDTPPKSYRMGSFTTEKMIVKENASELKNNPSILEINQFSFKITSMDGTVIEELSLDIPKNIQVSSVDIPLRMMDNNGNIQDVVLNIKIIPGGLRRITLPTDDSSAGGSVGVPGGPGGTSPECSDGVDNDGNGLTDYPNDPGCSAPDDPDEVSDGGSVPPPAPTGWDLSSAVYDGKSFIVDETSSPVALTFKPDGTKMYVLEDNDKTIYQYSLTNWDISSAQYEISFNVGEKTSLPFDFAFNSEGTKMYVVDYLDKTIYQYSLTNWDISSAQYEISFSVAGQMSSSATLAFKPDGMKVYVGRPTTNTIYQYPLTNWDISSAQYESNFDAKGFGRLFSTDIAFKSDGNKMYTLELDSTRTNNIDQYSITDWDISSAQDDFVSFSAKAQTSYPVAFAFKPDGTKMYVLGYYDKTIYQYSTVTPS